MSLRLDYAPDRLLVKFRDGLQPERQRDGAWHTGQPTLDRLLAGQHVQATEQLFLMQQSRDDLDALGLSRIYVVRLEPDFDVLQAVKAFAADPNVEWVEPDYLACPIDTIPDDPLFADQWGLAQIEAPAAWDVVIGSQTVVIAVVDSGMDATHPDLSGKLWTNPGEIAGNGLDDDNNGYIDDMNGWDFVNDDNDPGDDHGHGSQVAGIAAAATDNGSGIAGVCWGCRIMPVKAMQASGVANYSDIAQGVLYSAQKGARVINLSLGGYSESHALQTAIQAAAGTYGAVIVAGAGNDNLSTPFYPAAYPEVLAVAGTGQADAKAALANFGAWVDVSAPAVAIKTTLMGGDYGAVDGSSYAAAFVAGIAGLLRSQNSDWSADMVRAQVIHTVDNIDNLNPGYAGLLGSGRVNADQAVRTTALPSLATQGYTIDGVANGRPEPGSTVDLDVTLYNNWADASSVHATFSSSDPYVTLINASASYGTIAAYTSGTNTTAFRFSVGTLAPYAYDMALSLHVTADGGYSVSIPITVTTSPGTTYVHGNLSTQVWTNDRTYIIDNEAGVGAGQVLTIEPGTVVRFSGDHTLSIAGTLIADGTEAEPIVIAPSEDGWGRISFSPSSVPAVFDGDGDYVSGSILRYARISVGGGISVSGAIPYLAHNQLEHGSISCHDCDGAHIEENQITGATLFATVGVGDMQQTKPMLISGNIVTGGKIEIMTGGWAPVLVTGNEVRNAPDVAMEVCGVSELSYNRIEGAVTGIRTCSGLIAHNLVAGTTSHGIEGIGGPVAPVLTNTIVPKQGCVVEGVSGLHNNNLVGVRGEYSLRAGDSNVDATGNWWGTTSASAIEAAIYDGGDEFGLGMVDYSGYLSSAVPDAPAYVAGVYISPDTTLGIQTAIFEVEFSRPMDQRFAPELSFRSSAYGAGTFHNTYDLRLTNDLEYAIAPDPNGPYWPGTGADAVLRDNPVYIIEDNSQWLDDHTYHATYDITSLIPRGEYLVSVAGATGTDGFEIAPTLGYTFTVDYAVAIGDSSAPPTPTIEACASTNVGTLSASWSAHDPDSAITLYRYAIGTTRGGNDVINWTDTLDTSFARTGLSLTVGQTYYVAVKVRNEGGLWSEPGISGVIAGSGECTVNMQRLYLPLVRRG